MNLLLRPVRSSLGSKYVMAVTGLVLLGFVIGHMAGNLQIFLGKQALNDYAHHLEELWMLLWTARVVLLVASSSTSIWVSGCGSSTARPGRSATTATTPCRPAGRRGTCC